MHSLQPPATPAPPPRNRLWLLAVVSLAAAAAAESLCAVGLANMVALESVLGRGAELYISIAASLLWMHALLAGLAPAVLAQGHFGFRAMLIALHLLIGWAIQIGGYAALLPVDSVMFGELAGGVFVATLGMSVGFGSAMVCGAILWGWTLTLRGDDPWRPTVSVRGLLIATAAAALVLASPRIIAPWIGAAARSVYGYWYDDRGPLVGIDDAANQALMPVMPLGIGFLLAITVASAMWIGHSRLGWRVWMLGSLAAGLLVSVVQKLGGGGAGRWDPLLVAAVVSACFLVGSLQAKLQTVLWHRSGWQLIRVRRRQGN